MRTVALVGAARRTAAITLAELERLPTISGYLDGAAELTDLVGDPAALERIADGHQDPVGGGRLVDEVERAAADGIDAAVAPVPWPEIITIGTSDIALTQLQHVEAVHAGHLDVEQHGLRAVVVDRVDRRERRRPPRSPRSPHRPGSSAPPAGWRRRRRRSGHVRPLPSPQSLLERAAALPLTPWASASRAQRRGGSPMSRPRAVCFLSLREAFCFCQRATAVSLGRRIDRRPPPAGACDRAGRPAAGALAGRLLV